MILNGWKEIAGHVQRGTRTVQRWERSLGFPVLRLGQGARAPVVADSEKVDQWLEHWGKNHAGPPDALLLLKFAEARRSALHKRVEELMQRRAELLKVTSKLKIRQKAFTRLSAS